MNANSDQWTIIGLIVFLLALEVARSPAVKTFFGQARAGASNSLSATAHGTQAAPNPDATLDWHLLAYWGIAALLLIALAGEWPGVVRALLILIIVEEILVHWSSYTSLLAPPTK